MKRIIDEFTNLPVSRERKRQLRRIKRGLCLRGCGQVAVYGGFCSRHYAETLEASRRRKGTVRRYLGARGYKLVKNRR